MLSRATQSSHASCAPCGGGTPPAPRAGEWLDGRFEGKGTYTWPSGATYTGQWKNGRKHGQGRFLWANGTLYEVRRLALCRPIQLRWCGLVRLALATCRGWRWWLVIGGGVI